MRNAARFVVEGGCRAVKLEGGAQRLPMIKAILAAEIPVMGHLGLTPQSVNALGGFKVQGRRATEARRLLDEARQLADAGIFALVLECVPADVAARITEAVPVPTIGIGAGRRVRRADPRPPRPRRPDGPGDARRPASSAATPTSARSSRRPRPSTSPTCGAGSFPSEAESFASEPATRGRSRSTRPGEGR